MNQLPTILSLLSSMRGDHYFTLWLLINLAAHSCLEKDLTYVTRMISCRITNAIFFLSCLENGKGRKENVGYLAQQSIEKSIKAVLCFKGIAVPHTHKLAALIPLIEQALNFPFGLEISELSYFATVGRYMEGSYDLGDEEVKI